MVCSGKLVVAIGLSVAGGALGACSDTSDGDIGWRTPAPGSMAAAGGTPVAGGSSAAGGADAGGIPSLGVDGPFVVSDYFSPTTTAGDAAINGRVTSMPCEGRPKGARGKCYRFKYEPGDQLFAAVYWMPLLNEP